MLRAFLAGARLAVRCWPLALALWLLSTMFGASFAWASGYWLACALGRSTATRTLLKDLDPNVLVDLYYHHFESFRMLLLLGGFLVTGYTLLWCWLHGVVLATVQGKGHVKLPDAFQRGWSFAALMLRLLVIAVTLQVAFACLVFGSAWSLWYWTIAGTSALLRDCIAAASAVIWLPGFILLVAIHDHARIRACAHGQGAVSAFLWAARFVLRGGEHAFLLALLLNFTVLLVWGVFESVAWVTPADSALGVSAAVLWAEIFAYTRLSVRIWFFGAQSDLQSPA